VARYKSSIVSQTAQIAGTPSGVTVNGYVGYLGASATAGYRLRRVTYGLQTTTAAAITAGQITLAIYKQTVAPVGTGLAATVVGVSGESWVPADPTAGFISTTATTIGTTGPTIGATPWDRRPVNTQITLDVPYEFQEELVVQPGTANGLAFVIVGVPGLPSLSQLVIDVEYEV
jgi:hypothetical protein